VLCTERLDVAECIEELEAVMAKPRFRETPESLRLADDLAIAWSVRAALRRDARTAAAKVTVACDAGVVRLEGGAIDAAAARAAAEVAAGIEGVRSIENDMSCRAAAGSA
jgi:osmotically-inducible protein OsmY